MEASSAQATLAHYWDDAADTLAGNQSSPSTESLAPSEPSMLHTVLYGAAATVAVFWLGHWINVWRRTRREKAFNLELRRRHGIPDSDTRPFNVAYQEASIAARESVRKSLPAQSEIQEKQTSSRDVSLSNGFRPLARSRPPIPQFPGQQLVRVPSGSFNFGYTAPVHPTSSLDPSRAYSQLPNAASATGSWGPRYAADNFRATSVPAVPTVSSRSAFAVAAASGSLRPSNTFASGTNDGRAWQSSSRPSTLSRTTGNVHQIRSRKRLYLTADEEAEEQATVPNDKRSRTAAWGADAMIDGDNEPTWAQSYPADPQPVAESQAPQTGKTKGKRPADDGEGDLRTDGKRRQTKSSKHRTKQSDMPEKRGTKRERKEVDTASVLNDVMPVHKRGRAGDVDLSIVKEEELDDEEDPTVSRNPLCGGRRIGQKWTSNGQEYMVGPNGDRLRLVTVKESRKKYFMPADSKHADNFNTVDVFVEKWLTEEQYVKAKADGLLAWQESENLPSPVKQESSEKAIESGKENQADEERPRVTAITLRAPRTANSVWNTPGQSPLTANDPHTNPFTTVSAPQSPGPRRVKYTIGAVPPAALNASRMMSNWEKQEREAQALKNLRERRAAEAAAKAPKPAPAPALVPSISLTSVPSTPAPAAPAIKVIAPTPGSSVSGPPPTSMAPPTDGKLSPFGFAPTPKPAAPVTAPAPASNPFSFAPKKEEAAKPVFSATPAPAAAPSKTPSLFPPVASAAPASTTSAPSAIMFGAAKAAPAATASPFGAPTPAPASTTTAPKPSPFAFSAPSTQPAAPTTSTTTASAPAPSPFGATPAAPASTQAKPTGFSFGAPASATPAASAPAPASANVFGAQAPAKPASTGFSFNTSSAATNGSSTAKPAGTFSFGATPAANPAPASTGFGSTATGTSGGFGSGFGTNASTTTNGATSSLFSFGGAPKPAAPAPTTSGFGAQPAAPASNGFKFGETNTNTSTNGTTGTNNGFSFGAPAKPTVSIPATTSFGAPPTAATPTTTNTPFTFGAAANNGAAASPATPSKPLFSMGAPTASPVMGTRQISTSRRVQRAISKPPQ